MPKKQPKRSGENPDKSDEAPVSSGRPVVADVIEKKVDSVRTMLGTFTAPPGKKDKETLQSRRLGSLRRGDAPSEGGDDPESAENRRQIIETMLAELEQFYASPSSDLWVKAKILKKAILSLDPQDWAVARGKIRFLVQACVPNIGRDKLTTLAQSLFMLLSEDRRIDSILMEIVNAFPKKPVVSDEESDFGDTVMDKESGTGF